MNEPGPEAHARASLGIAGGLLAITIVGALMFVSLVHVASPGAGERVMARTVAVTAEIDASMPAIEQSLVEAAEQSEQDPITVPNFPIPVEVSRQLALSGDREALRDAIVEQSAEQMYDSGVSVWDDADPEGQQDIADSSTAGAIRGALWFVGSTPFAVFLALSIVAVLASAVLAVLLTLQMHAMGRLIALGVVFTVAGALSLAVTLLLSVSASSIGGSDAFSDGLSEIMSDAVGVGLRNSLIVTLLGVSFVALGAGGSFIEQNLDAREGAGI